MGIVRSWFVFVFGVLGFRSGGDRGVNIRFVMDVALWFLDIFPPGSSADMKSNK